MKWIKQNNAVFGTTSNIVTINNSDVIMLKQNVAASADKRIRICTHQQPEDGLHEMLIVLLKGTYVRPHKHVNKSESFHIIEGLLDVIIFDDTGKIIDIITMGDFSSGKNFFYRLSTALFHTIFLRSDSVTFHETTNGPFQKENTIYPEWAPVSENKIAVNEFMTMLENSIEPKQICKEKS